MYVSRGVAILAFLYALLAAWQASAAAETVRFHIPAGPASATLRKFASQSDMNVLFQSDEVNTQRTRAISGSHEPIDALRLMLVGSGLSYQFQEPNSVLVSASGKDVSSYDGGCGRACGERQFDALDSTAPVVLVTGMSIDAALNPGQLPVVDPYITLTHQDFITGGYQTVGEVLRSLPQNFGGGLNVGVIFAGGSQNTTSLSAASTVNLRGLGSGSTLVLLNGQRLATAEGSGAVDVSLIPISAIERIEITTGSASAQYGSDAVAGVVNIIVRTDFQGLEVIAGRGIATGHANSLQHYGVVAGHAIGDGNAFGATDCVWQSEINAHQRKYVPATLADTTLMPAIQRCSSILSAKGSLSQSLDAGILGAYTSRSVYQRESLDLSSGSISATTRSDVHQYAINAILKQHFLHSWTATLSGGLSADNIGSIDLVTQSSAPDFREYDRLDNRLWTGQLVVSGTLAETRAGSAQVSVGAGYHQQDFLLTHAPGGELNVSRRRRVRFAFAQSSIPLVPSPVGMKDPTALSLELAVRSERYSEGGRTTNSKIALTYKPMPTLKLQASWGTSSRVPLLLQEFDTSQAVLEVVPDPLGVNGQSHALLRFGGNPQLKPETSTDTELDLTYTPEGLPGASLQLGLYSIFYRQRIDYPTLNTADPLSDPNISPFVIRNPSPDTISQILAQSAPLMDLTAGQFEPQDAGVVVIDDRNQNFVRQRVTGVDFLWKYECDTPFGGLDSSLNLAYLDLRQQISNETTLRRLSGTAFYPPLLRGRFGVNWSYRRYLASLFVNYTGGSREVVSPGQATPAQPSIASWTTVDGQIGMVFRGNAHWGDTKLTLSAQNLFDRHPPLIGSIPVGTVGVNYDSTNTSSVGRFLTLQLTHVW